MVQWSEKRIIHAPIDKVWDLFSDEQLQLIMPQLEKHQLVEGPPNQVGSKYAQQNRMGQRVVSYVMEITAYEDSPQQKRKDIGFVAAGLFQVSLSFVLSRIDEEKTLFVYSGSNRGANLVGRTLLKLDQQNSSQQEVEELMVRVAEAAES
ncbi:SRPBCC family protein [Planococcus soli]|uniref:SRPBCC family protein n=1 Tax=Planococcus soli TaxID=2666072 RepID=UPI00115F6240|nr:SRPBCC family protein [Planococcus soli]